MKEMYKGKAFSPLTVLTKPINSLETSIEVEDSSLLPPAPNYATIGDSETIKYGAVAGNILTDCIRGVEGEAAAHEINEKISRLFTALDYDTLLENVEGIPAAIADKVSEHNTATDAHQDLRGSIDEVSKAVEAFPATIDSKMDTHNTNIEAHAAIQTNISTQIDTHNTSLESHTDIRDALTEQLQLHNISESAHEDLRESFEAVSTEIETKISGHNSDLEAHATLITRLTALEDALANPAPSASTPVGSVIQYAGAAVPEKWLKCEGQTVLRTTYPELFAAIGTVYGSGDGSTTFKLPDFRGRVPGGVGGNLGNLGASGGAATHTLSVGEMPSHSHPFSAEAQTSYYVFMSGNPMNGTPFPYAYIGKGVPQGACGYAGAEGIGLGAVKSTLINVSLFTSGSSYAHNNLQPYLTTNFIIYTGR